MTVILPIANSRPSGLRWAACPGNHDRLCASIRTTEKCRVRLGRAARLPGKLSLDLMLPTEDYTGRPEKLEDPLMRFLTVSLITAVFSLTPANASLLQFSAITNTGEITSFTLDTTVPNTYDPIRYPNIPIRGVYLNAAYDLSFEGTDIPLSDVTTTPGETGDGRPLTEMQVGPLFNNESLSLDLIFLDPTLVTPLSSDPFAYERSFEPI